MQCGPVPKVFLEWLRYCLRWWRQEVQGTTKLHIHALDIVGAARKGGAT